VKLQIGEDFKGEFTNDANDFMDAMAEPDHKRHFDSLQNLVYKHYYSPFMNPVQSSNEWAKVYNGISRVSIIDAKLAHEIAVRCGDFKVTNAKVFANLLLEKDVTEIVLKRCLDVGVLFY
jgi:hypothetical protein